MKKTCMLVLFLLFFLSSVVYADTFEDDFDDLSHVDTEQTDALVDTAKSWIQLPLRPLPNALALNQYVGKGYAVAQEDGVAFYSYDEAAGKATELSSLKINVSNPLAVSLFQEEMGAFVLLPTGDIKYFEMGGTGFVENPSLSVLGTKQVVSITSTDTGAGKQLFTLDEKGHVQGYVSTGTETVPIPTMSLDTGLSDPVAISAVPNRDMDFVVTSKTGAVYYAFDGSDYLPIQMVTGLSGVVSSQVDESGNLLTAVKDKVHVHVQMDDGSLADATAILGQSSVSNPYSVSLNSNVYEYGVLTGDGTVKYYESAGGSAVENTAMTMTGLTLTKWHETPRKYTSLPIRIGYPVDVIRLYTEEQNDPNTTITYEISTDGGNSYVPITAGDWTDVTPGDTLVLRAHFSTTERQYTPRLKKIILEYGQISIGELTATKQYLPGPSQKVPLPTTEFPVYERSSGQVEFTVKTTGAVQQVVAIYSDGSTQALVPVGSPSDEQNTWFGWYVLPITVNTGDAIGVNLVATRRTSIKTLEQSPFIVVDGMIQSKLKIRLVR